MKLDLKTKLYLILNGLIIDEDKEYSFGRVERDIAYTFENYEEFKNYFLEYVDKVDDAIISLAINTVTKNGGIVASKSLCDFIITGYRTNYFNNESSIPEFGDKEVLKKKKIR